VGGAAGLRQSMGRWFGYRLSFQHIAQPASFRIYIDGVKLIWTACTLAFTTARAGETASTKGIPNNWDVLELSVLRQNLCFAKTAEEDVFVGPGKLSRSSSAGRVYN
jgi:hypothetical protein